VILVLGFCTIGCLFFHTPLSFLAREIFVIYGLLFFASAVLDINAGVTGAIACENMFANTKLFDAFKGLNVTSVTCTTENVAALCSIDMVLSIQCFFLHTAWLFCKDKYVRRPGQLSAEEKALIKKTPAPAPAPKSAPVQNPIHAKK
jgi:hypothetical protein